MASSSEGGRGGKPPASSSIEDKPAVTLAEGKSVKKKKVVRMSEEQIASYLSFKKTDPVPPIPGPRRLIDALSKEFVASLPQEAQDGLAAMDLHLFNEGIAEINAADDDLAREADDVRRQYMEKGYVEYEVDEDQDVPARAPPPPAPGRRRRRPGVSRKSGTTKRIN